MAITTKNIVFIGGSGCGKSALAIRIAKPEASFSEPAPTEVAVFYNAESYHLTIKDTTDKPQYQSLLPIFCNNADEIWLCYDITKKTSLDQLKILTDALRYKLPVGCTLRLVGLKADLPASNDVTAADTDGFIASFNEIYINHKINTAPLIVSAKENTGVNELIALAMGPAPLMSPDEADMAVFLEAYRTERNRFYGLFASYSSKDWHNSNLYNFQDVKDYVRDNPDSRSARIYGNLFDTTPAPSGCGACRPIW